jgi:hypothetical protein
MTLGEFRELTKDLHDRAVIMLGFEIVVIGDRLDIPVDPVRASVHSDKLIVIHAPAGDEYCNMYRNLAMTNDEADAVRAKAWEGLDKWTSIAK